MATRKKTTKKAAKKPAAAKPFVVNGVDASTMTEEQIQKCMERLDKARQNMRAKNRAEHDKRVKPFRDKVDSLLKTKAKVEFLVQLPIKFTIGVEADDYPRDSKDFDNFIVNAKAKLEGSFEPKTRRLLQGAIDDVMCDVCSDILHLAPKRAIPEEILSYNKQIQDLKKEVKAAGLSWDDIC